MLTQELRRYFRLWMRCMSKKEYVLSPLYVERETLDIVHSILVMDSVDHLFRITGWGTYLKVSRFEASNSFVRDIICFS